MKRNRRRAIRARKEDALPSRFLRIDPETIRAVAEQADTLAGHGVTLATLPQRDPTLGSLAARYLAVGGMGVAVPTLSGLATTWYDLYDVVEAAQHPVLHWCCCRQYDRVLQAPKAMERQLYQRSESVQWWGEADDSDVLIISVRISQDGGVTYEDPFVLYPGLVCF